MKEHVTVVRKTAWNPQGPYHWVGGPWAPSPTPTRTSLAVPERSLVRWGAGESRPPAAVTSGSHSECVV